jgi:flagellar basal-body rod modification protein FlgD
MSTSAVGGVQGLVGQQTPTSVANSNAFDNMDLQQFITLLITEMQNQDPTNPMDNSQILQQISQIKSIASNDKLSTTLTSMQLQQKMLSANILMNQNITGLNDQGTKVEGKVDKVSIDKDSVTLHIGADTVRLKNVTAIDPTA